MSTEIKNDDTDLTFDTLATKLAEHEGSPEVARSMIVAIRSASKSQQATLLRAAMEQSAKREMPTENWNPRQTLAGVIYHAVGVREIESPEQAEIRMQIERDFAGPKTDEQYAAMDWIPAEVALQQHDIQE